jgi:hypothetical protein
MFKLIAILAIASMTPAAAFTARELPAPVEADEFGTVNGCMEFYPGPPASDREPPADTEAASVEVMPDEIIIEDAADEVHEDPPDKPHNDIGIPIYPDDSTSILPRAPEPERDERARSHKFAPRPRPDIAGS